MNNKLPSMFGRVSATGKGNRKKSQFKITYIPNIPKKRRRSAKRRRRSAKKRRRSAKKRQL